MTQKPEDEEEFVYDPAPLAKLLRHSPVIQLPIKPESLERARRKRRALRKRKGTSHA